MEWIYRSTHNNLKYKCKLICNNRINNSCTDSTNKWPSTRNTCTNSCSKLIKHRVRRSSNQLKSKVQSPLRQRARAKTQAMVALIIVREMERTGETTTTLVVSLQGPTEVPSMSTTTWTSPVTQTTRKRDATTCMTFTETELRPTLKTNLKIIICWKLQGTIVDN